MVKLIPILIMTIAIPVYSTLASDGENIKINGLIQLWGKESNAPNTYSSQFLKRSELKLSGTIIPDRVGFEFLMDPASVPTYLIQDLNIYYHYHSMVRFRVGQMKYPLTMEGLTPSSQLDFIDRSIITAREYGDRRDIGYLVYGDNHKFDYSLGLFNGSGPNNQDNNDNKDLSGRFVFHASDKIKFGTSFYRGPHNRLATDEFDVNRNRAGVEFAYTGYPFGVKTEYMQGSDDDANSGGYYGSVTYSVNSTYQFGARFEGWDPNHDSSDDETTMTTLGVNYKLKGDAAKIMANYVLTNDNSASKNMSEFLVQFQVEF